MSTSWDMIYDRFYKKIERDADFFSYNNIDPAEAALLAKTRAKNYLIESISKLTLNCAPDIDFNDYDDVGETFTEDLTSNEIDLMANLMREMYFEKDYSLLKAFKTYFSPRDLNVFSPANERKTFTDMLAGIVKTNKSLIKEYMARDRITGKLKTINYSLYSE